MDLWWAALCVLPPRDTSHHPSEQPAPKSMSQGHFAILAVRTAAAPSRKFFFPPLKLGESNHFVFHVGIKSKLLLNRFSVGSRLESGSDSRDESNTGSVTDPMFGWSTSLRFSSEISHLYNSDLSLLGSTVSFS